MKKLTAITLVAVLTLSIGTSAFAAKEDKVKPNNGNHYGQIKHQVTVPGDPELLDPKQYTGAEAEVFVKPQDFGVMQFSGVNGYSVGLKLSKTAAGVQKVEVSLLDGNDIVLATNTSTSKLLTESGNQLSTPFNINGSFTNDGYWNYGSWNGTVTNVPTKAVIKVTDLKGNTYTVVNDTLTGNPADLKIPTPIDKVIAIVGTDLSYTADQFGATLVFLAAATSNTSVIRAKITDGILTVTPVNPGLASVSVVYRKENGEVLNITFEVVVHATP
ncbi:hypothetical protein LJR153_005980 [Paenibacillus sp. LjRoot153]|uniref:hypothetical protein n=1 Tax=Paenibacillus sp. LjRoot153 TaxID=3342270 RepID=UPI003ECCEF97